MLKFREVEVPAVAAGVLGPDGYQTRLYVSHGCGHPDYCEVTLGKEQMALLGVAYLQGKVGAAQDLVNRIHTGVEKCAQEMRCRGCLERDGAS